MKTLETEQSDNLFDALMDAAVDAVIVIDDHGCIRRFSRAAQNMFGYSLDDVRGRNINMLMPEPHRQMHDHYLERYRQTRVAAIIGAGRETSGLKSNGMVFPIQLSVGEISGQQEGNYYVGIIRDLTEQKLAEEQVHQLEDQLLHADRLVILGELTAGIAHEINQPLTAIAAYADAGKSLVGRGSGIELQDVQNIYERIAEQARRAGEVVQRMRQLVRTGTLSKARHDLNQTIQNILLLFEYEINKSNVELQFIPDQTLQTMYMDEIQIQQIIVNLVKNSLDAIHSAEQFDGQIEVRVEHLEKEVKVLVLDNGPGVPENLQKRLFESFFTTKPKGVGLGLSICKSIAAAHGGSLSFSSPPQGGSCFVLKLPLEYIG
jgi:two-component system sensor kinase FixL